MALRSDNSISTRTQNNNNKSQLTNFTKKTEENERQKAIRTRLGGG